MTSFASRFSFQDTARRNARRSVRSDTVHREQRQEADRAVVAAAESAAARLLRPPAAHDED